jgi:phage tail-like protein
MADDVDTKVVGKAFKVEINGQFLPIKSYSGGDPVAEKAEASSGGSKQNEATVGHNYISELTLQAFMTPTQKIFADAAHKVANLGQNERFTITITELAKDKSVVKTFVYDNCLLTSLDFPRLNAHSGEILVETASFKPEILDVS